MGLEKERERALLESLRSPGPDTTRAAAGGWGLGINESEKDDEEDEPELNWDQAQVRNKRLAYCGLTLSAGPCRKDGGNDVSASAA